MYWNVSVGLKCVRTPRILSEMNLGPLKTLISRKTIFSDDTSCVNFVVVWNELAKSIKLLISIPSSWGILTYSEQTSRVARIAPSGSGAFSMKLAKWVVSLIYDSCF